MRLRLTRSRAEDPAAFRLPRRTDLPSLLLYLGAGAVYVTVGVFETDVLLSIVVAVGYLLLVAWLVPSAVRRRR